MAPTKTKRTVVFIHPDLGIGGAERLVIDAAVGLQNRGNRVVVFTSHCDPSHCFDEARDGTLDVRVRGNTIIPPSVLGRFSILCAILRQLHLVFQISLLTSELRALKPTVFFVDQLSACVPLLRIVSPATRILFYCHFPDKLLAQRQGLLKKAYRVPFDWLESWTTGASDVIVVNSKFTRGIFGDAFPGLKARQPAVVYPCVDVEEEKQNDGNGATRVERREEERIWQDKKVLLSINRFERKKDVGLAIRAFAGLSADARQKTRLVIAGGHDTRVPENVSYHLELQNLADSLHLPHATATNLISALDIPAKICVLFLLSVPTALKSTLLSSASLLIYTPKNEHFGIVPLEAMLARVPVLAANTGGPTETVVDWQTGWLRPVDDVSAWTEVMQEVLEQRSDEYLAWMGEQGRNRVVEMFSKGKMAERLEGEIDGMMKAKKRPDVLGNVAVVLVLSAGAVVALLVAWLLSLNLRSRLEAL